MDFRPLNDTERTQLIQALRGKLFPAQTEYVRRVAALLKEVQVSGGGDAAD